MSILGIVGMKKFPEAVVGLRHLGLITAFQGRCSHRDEHPKPSPQHWNVNTHQQWGNQIALLTFCNIHWKNSTNIIKAKKRKPYEIPDKKKTDGKLSLSNPIQFCCEWHIRIGTVVREPRLPFHIN